MSWMMRIESVRISESIDLDRGGAWDLLESEIECMIPGESMTLTYEGDGDDADCSREI